MKPGMDYWRNYFRSANSDIFGVIDHAIMVAASDCPKEFRMRRDRIAERLFSSRLSQCSGCHRVELAVPPSSEEDAIGGDQGEEEGGDEEIDVCGDFEEGGGSKGSKVNSSSRQNETDNGEANLNNDQLGSNYSYDEAEALTDEIEEQSQVFDEVLRIKSVILNHRDETDSTLFDSLRRLQLMALSVDTIKATEIGKVVNNLRKHGSAEIRHLARTLIELWKDLVDEWFNASKTIVSRNESTPDSGNPSVLDDEYGLPSPPMDEAFFATQATGIELSQFFDGMDDDGNPHNAAVEMNRNRGNGRKPSNEARSIPKPKQQPMHNEVNALTRNSQQMRPSKPLNNNSGPRRPLNQNLEQKAKNSSMLQRRTDHQIAGQRNPSSGGLQQQNKLKCSDEVAVQMKLEATKRKLQESYQQANNAKRQRTIQVMELHDLPKQGGTANRNPNMMKHGNGNRHWANGRR